MTTFERRLRKVEDALQARTQPDVADRLRQAMAEACARRLRGLPPCHPGGTGPLAERLQRAYARASQLRASLTADRRS
jgi:hypothetical protein